MKIKRNFPAVLFTMLAILPGSACLDTVLANDGHTHGENPLVMRVTIESGVLHETRTVKIHLPPSYQNSEHRYPVLYVLDAEHEEHFNKAIESTHSLIDRGVIPQVMIVGVENTDRLRDMNVPDFEYQGKYIEGRANRFLDFISRELIPHINRNYRTVGPRIVYGASASAVFSMYTMVTRPEVFKAYIASSPSFFVNADVLNENTRKFFAAKTSVNRIFFLNLGTEDTAKRVRQTREYADLVRELAPPEFQWELKQVDGAGHVPESSLEDGLKVVFSHIDNWGQSKNH